MLRVRHLDSSTWLCWWQRASLLWNKGANCPWWTSDQTSASCTIWRCFSVPSNFECNWWNNLEIEESTQRICFKIWFYQTVFFYVFLTSIVLWHLVVPCDMAGCETIWLEESHNSDNSVAEASTGTFRSHIDTARPLKDPNQLGKVEEFNYAKGRCKTFIPQQMQMASCWISLPMGILFICLKKQISFHRGNASLKWRTFQPRHRCQLTRTMGRCLTVLSPGTHPKLSSHAMPVISIPRSFSWAEELRELWSKIRGEEVWYESILWIVHLLKVRWNSWATYITA